MVRIFAWFSFYLKHREVHKVRGIETEIFHLLILSSGVYSKQSWARSGPRAQSSDQVSHVDDRNRSTSRKTLSDICNCREFDRKWSSQVLISGTMIFGVDIPRCKFPLLNSNINLAQIMSYKVPISISLLLSSKNSIN